MILLPHTKDKTYAVYGLGRTGLSAARSLHKSGAKVLAWDDDAAKCTALLDLTGVAAVDVASWDWSAVEALVLSPGVPLTNPAPHPVVIAAHDAGVSVIGDMELFVQALGPKSARSAPIIAITGTNGKSTTTALIGHILSRAGYFPRVGGNIGKAVLDLDPPVHKRVYVFEVSSYQMDLTPSLAPDVSVLLNLAPDHLNRHGDMGGYIAAKTKIFKDQQADDLAIIGIDDGFSKEICAKLRRQHLESKSPKVQPITVGQSLGQGIYALGGRLIDASQDPAVEVADLSGIVSLQGAHNWQNTCAAYAATRAIGAERGRIADALQSFPGLAHRQEIVGQSGNVTYINDSKATNGEATSRALETFENIYWIVGGEPKDGGLDAALSHLDGVRKAYLIGKAAPQFAEILNGKVDVVIAETLAKATELASADAFALGETAVVLLSPACASFDQFTDFEARGDAFRKLVQGLVPEEIAEEVGG